MPTYDYQCTTCGKRFDVVQSIKADPLVVCIESECEQEVKGKGLVERVISGGSGVIYTGDGFYLTDYVYKPDGSKEKSAREKSGGEKVSSEKSGGEKDTSEKSGGEKGGTGKSGAEQRDGVTATGAKATSAPAPSGSSASSAPSSDKNSSTS